MIKDRGQGKLEKKEFLWVYCSQMARVHDSGEAWQLEAGMVAGQYRELTSGIESTKQMAKWKG